ncbi:MAG: glycosyltransferase family 39 protein, partial [Elusimicrobiota bacterium]
MTAHREPGYPLLLAALYSVFGPRYWALCLLHALLGTASVWLIFLLGRRSFSAFTGLAAAALAAMNPQLLYYGAMARRETLQAFLCLLGAWAILKACEKPSPRAIILAGGVWAFHALTNSAFLPAGLAV